VNYNTDEKLEALHHLKIKSEEVDKLNKKLDEYEVYRISSQTLQIDIETIRKNYSSLYEQHV
jgi:Asp-tRNA(Asn)/Glu-tRNA(Gln) amidotransferase C subunit